MKKVISIILGVVALLGIGGLTIYTLTNKGVRKEEIKENEKVKELVNSNYNGNTLAELYNIYLNQQKHKLKLEYKLQLEKEIDEGYLELTVYFDGGNIINEKVVANLKIGDTDIKNYLDNTTISDIKLNIDDIQIIKIEDRDYILLELNCYGKYNKSYYFMFDDLGDLLVPNGAVIKDESVYYQVKNNIFYSDTEQIMAKFQDNEIYVLEPIIEEEEIMIGEYKYYYKDGKAQKEELNIYKDIKIKE